MGCKSKIVQRSLIEDIIWRCFIRFVVRLDVGDEGKNSINMILEFQFNKRYIELYDIDVFII